MRKILQPALHLIAKEDDDRIQETIDREVSHFSEEPLKQGISCNKMFPDKAVGKNSETLEGLRSAEQTSPDLSFLVVKNSTGEKHLFVDLGE